MSDYNPTLETIQNYEVTPENIRMLLEAYPTYSLVVVTCLDCNQRWVDTAENAQEYAIDPFRYTVGGLV